MESVTTGSVLTLSAEAYVSVATESTLHTTSLPRQLKSEYVLLVGIVAKNGILIVEFANQIKEKSGCTPLEAAREAAKRRFRPILMTSLSTILGAVPLVLIGSASRFAMGVSLVGGLGFATFLTLFVVPAAYSYIASGR